MRGSSSLVLILFSATAAVVISNDNIQRDKTSNIRTPLSRQNDSQLPHHLRNNINRQLRSDTNDISTIEFCGKCTWEGNISCEARAQYLVRNSQSSNLSLVDARISILETCKSDGSDLSSIPLDAFCGSCQYMKMNFNCNSRVDYLVTTYYLGREKAIESLLKDGQCIDVYWVPPTNTIDDNRDDSSLSNGAIIGIVIGITIILCCCIGLGALYYNTKQKLNEQAATQQASQPAGGKRAKASEIRKKVMAEANARNNTDSPDSSSREEEEVKKKKSLSFSPPVVWNITQDGDKPDPPTHDEVINKEKIQKEGIDNTQQVLDMIESALDTTTNNNDDPPDFRDSQISELSCNIDPPTDDEDEGVVLPSTADEEQALSNTNGHGNSSGQATNEKQDALTDNETRQNEEGIVRRISLEP